MTISSPKKIIILILLNVLALLSCTQTGLLSAGHQVNSNPALWRVANNNSTVYFFGSVHALPKQIKWYGPKVRQAYQESHEIVLERVPSEKDKEIFLRYEKSHGYLPKGKVISDYLTASEYKKYMHDVKLLNLNPYKAKRIQPWLFAMAVASIINKNTSMYGVDNLISIEATKDGKVLSGLERTDQTLASLSADPLELQIRKLKQKLNQKVDAKANLAKDRDLLYSWAVGDTERTARILAQEFTGSTYGNLITKRNSMWYPKIKSYLSRNQVTMVVVGQAHLIGRFNILRKLERDGFRVSRIQ